MGNTFGSNDDAAHDFVLVTGNCAISPHRQISVRLGRFNLEMNGVQEVDVHHDPLIQADRLMMPETSSPYYIRPDEPPRQVKMIPFFSSQRISLYSVGFTPRSEGTSLIYSSPHYGREDAALAARHLSKRLDKDGAPPAYDLLAGIFLAIGMLDDWPTTGIGLQGSWDRVEVRFGLSFLQAVTEATGIGFSQASTNEALVAVHELRS